MTQTLYGILALGLMMLVLLTLQRGVASSANTQTFTELATPVQGIAADAFEHIDRQYFDRYVAKHVDDDVALATKTCGRVDDPALFSGFSSGAYVDSEDGSAAICTQGATPRDRFDQCFYVEGFHGLASPANPILFERDGYEYRIEDVTVAYVDDATFAASATPTFSKEVTLTITNEFMRDGTGDPIEMTFSRVFQYDRVTDPILFPYYGSGFPCPPVEPYPVRYGM